jgi:hypothetical protein
MSIPSDFQFKILIMKKDIPIRPVHDVGIAIIPESSGIWDVYLINLKKENLKHTLINTKGYGELDGEKVETACMRYYYEQIPAEKAVRLELINKDLTELANEYWLSFLLDDYMFDKKIVFVKGSISENFLTKIPIINRSGVLIM